MRIFVCIVLALAAAYVESMKVGSGVSFLIGYSCAVFCAGYIFRYMVRKSWYVDFSSLFVKDHIFAQTLITCVLALVLFCGPHPWRLVNVPSGFLLGYAFGCLSSDVPFFMRKVNWPTGIMTRIAVVALAVQVTAIVVIGGLCIFAGRRLAL